MMVTIIMIRGFYAGESKNATKTQAALQRNVSGIAASQITYTSGRSA